MARRRTVEARFDFRGGVNTELLPELLEPNELVGTVNARVSERGTIAKRTGSMALFDSITYGTIKDLPYWWDEANKLYFVAGTSFMQWTDAGGLVELESGLTGTKDPLAWEVFPVSATNRLFLASNDGLFYWNGTNLTQVTRPAPATPCQFLAVYQGRLWTGNSSYIEWSAPSDGSDFALANGAGYAKVDLGTGGPLWGIAAIGSSLLLMRERQINRLTLTGADNIDIARDSEGLSSDIGLLSALNSTSYCVAKNMVFFASQDGIYAASEAELVKLSDKIDGDMRDLLASEVPHLAHHRDRQTVRVSFEAEKVWWEYNYAIGAWSGPNSHAYQFNWLAPYEAGKLCGALGARIYDMDRSYTDGALSDGSGGVSYETTIEFPPFLFRDPRQVKTIQGVSSLEADLNDDTHVTLAWSSEMGSGSIELHSRGAGVRSYPFRLRARGRRISIVLTENLKQAFEVAGLVLEAVKGRRGG